MRPITLRDLVRSDNEHDYMHYLTDSDVSDYNRDTVLCYFWTMSSGTCMFMRNFLLLCILPMDFAHEVHIASKQILPEGNYFD